MESGVEAQIGKKLEKSFAVDEEDSSSHDDWTDGSEETKVEVAASTPWEELHDIYFKKRFSRPLNASMESVLLEDEEGCTINLSKMYDEKEGKLRRNKTESSSPPSRRAFLDKKKLSDDTLDVIDDLIKSIEKEVENDEMNIDIPIVSVVSADE